MRQCQALNEADYVTIGTEWGYLQTGNTPPEFGAPLVSRTIDLEYSSLVCQLAFNRTEPADVETINKFGAFDIEYPRLAIVDGDWDPWKPVSPPSLTDRPCFAVHILTFCLLGNSTCVPIWGEESKQYCIGALHPDI